MKIKLLESTIKSNFKELEVNVPQEAKYYRKIDDGFFFPEGEILFAIIPRYKPKEGSPVTAFTLVRITRNCQQYTDFHISDCKDEYFHRDYTPLKKVIADKICGNKRVYEYTWLRPEAFRIWTTYDKDGFIEITEEDFNTSRMKLLNKYLQQ